MIPVETFAAKKVAVFGLGGSGLVSCRALAHGGAEVIASQAAAFAQLGLDARPALINGTIGAVSMRRGEPFSVGAFTVRGGKIVAIDILADPERLRQLDLTGLDD